MKVRHLFISILLALTPCDATERVADSSANPVQPLLQDAVAPTHSPSAYGLMARMLFSLVVVIAVIWGALQLLQRISGRSAGGVGTSRVQVLERTYLAPKKAVYILRIGSRTLAVGVTDAQISPLAELDPEETLAAYPEQRAGGATPPFVHLLKDVRTRFLGGNGPGENA